MLRLHLSLAARSAAVNGTGESLPRVPGAPPPARVTPTPRGVTANGGGEPRLRRGSHDGGERRKCVENGGGGSVPGAKKPAGSMVNKEQSPGASRRRCADPKETRADESDHSGYDTAAGYSDFYESFSECTETPLSNGEAGAEDCAGDLRSCLGRKEPDLNSRRDESSSSSVLLWDHLQPCSSDEGHYITTHEIQLYEVDHDGESELGAGWDVDESSACYSCKDSSSFESYESQESSRTPQGTSCAGDPPPASGDLPVPGSASPDSRPENGNSGGRLHLSIQANSRAVNEGSGSQEKGTAPSANSLESGNQRKAENLTKPQTAKDAKSCHNVPPSAGAKFNWKAFGNSSGTSSAVSELDDADKEVRSLTARTFRSLACAGDEYLDTFSTGYRTSTDLSSEELIALNRCATYIDLKCRNTTGEKGHVEFPTKSAKLGVGQRAAGSEPVHPPAPGVAGPVNEKQGNPADKQTCKRQLHLSGKFEQIGSRVITLTETLNFRYDVKEHIPARREGERRVELARGVGGSRCADEVTECTVREEGGGSGRDTSKASEAMDGAQKKSKFASNLLQNVIWKKMQFEQELKMERGEITDTSFAGRTSPPAAEFPKTRDVDPNSNSSETSPVPGESAGEAAPCQDLSVQSHARPAAGEASDGRKGTLQRSQHSAFRCWKDSGRAAPGKPAQRVRAEIGGHLLCKETKMSHLFVPSIQKAPGKSEPGVNVKYSTCAEAGGGGSDTSRSPEIKIRLRKVKGSRQSPFSIAKLLTPNIAGGGPGKAGCDARCEAPLAAERLEESRARPPPFTVRDVRDNIHKLQAPIHQVRDVRKLVKSSYHVVTVDGGGPGGEPRGGGGPGVEPRGGGGSTMPPIVIKCQAVSRKELPGVTPERVESGSPGVEPAVKNGSAFGRRAAGGGGGKVPPGQACGSPPAAERRGAGARAGAASSSQLALEKLTAAVRTMEQLYVFDKNEWRRRSDPGPGPLAGSHVLSLIASEEASGAGGPPADVEPRAEPEQPAARSAAARNPPAGRSAAAAAPQHFAVAPQPSPLDSRPFRAAQSRPADEEEGENQRQPGAALPPAGAQQKPPPENYLTIPVKKPPAAPREPSPPAFYQHQQAQIIRLTPPAPDPLSPGKVQPVPPVLVDSPSVPCFPVPQTQRRMLLDPTTGQYYLVDTPVQPARRRLYDPETGQYVDVPMPQQPVAPMPVPMSPIAINPGTYGPTYMIYPGFLPPPAMLQTLPPGPDTECSETGKGGSVPRLQTEPQYLESPYYFPTGKSLTGTQTTTSRGCIGLSEGKPIISITSQQGPRIIAPPSFDGTTMSFVVEHR